MKKAKYRLYRFRIPEMAVTPEIRPIKTTTAQRQEPPPWKQRLARRETCTTSGACGERPHELMIAPTVEAMFDEHYREAEDATIREAPVYDPARFQD